MDYSNSSPMALNSSNAGLGSGMYEMVYQTDNLPPSGAATTATQFEEGGKGFDWNQGLRDLAGLWLANESKKDAKTQVPTDYRRGEDGRVYAVDPSYRNPPGAGGIFAGIPPSMLLIGGVILAVMMLKD